jgi:hypothetical protein
MVVRRLQLRINGSALGQLRTTDFFALGDWELREFHLSATSGPLRPASLALTPGRSFNRLLRALVCAAP